MPYTIRPAIPGAAPRIDLAAGCATAQTGLPEPA
jgi:hypothetical protein